MPAAVTTTMPWLDRLFDQPVQLAELAVGRVIAAQGDIDHLDVEALVVVHHPGQGALDIRLADAAPARVARLDQHQVRLVAMPR